MSKDDFCRCTPSEFYAAYDAWWQRETDLERGRWERMRMQCLCSLQPYSKKQLRAQDFMKFPWESEEQKATSCRSQQNGQSREEIMERYREAKKKGRDKMKLYIIILTEHNHPQQGAYKHSDTTQNQ